MLELVGLGGCRVVCEGEWRTWRMLQARWQGLGQSETKIEPLWRDLPESNLSEPHRWRCSVADCVCDNNKFISFKPQPVLFLKNVKVQKKVKVLTDTYEHMRYHVRKSAFPRVQNATRILLHLRFSTFMKKLVFKKTIIGQKHNFSGHFFYYYVKLKLSK